MTTNVDPTITDAADPTAVPDGYKWTEVGVIPEDWQLKPLSSLLDFRNGVNSDKRAYGQGIPFINVLEVITHSHLAVERIPGRITLPKNVINAFAVQSGDILFNRTSETQEEVGLASVYQDEELVVFGGFVIRGRQKTKELDSNYSGYAFRASIIHNQIVKKGQGAIRANIGQADLQEVRIPLPPPREQHAIAEALSDVDGLIASLNDMIAKKRAIKQGAMQQLLTGMTRLPGFSGEWESKSIGEFTDCTAGGTPSTERSEYWNGTIRWMNSGELNLKIVNEVEGRITLAGLRNSSTKILPPMCVLIGLAGQGRTRGTAAMNTVELCTNQSIAAIFPDKSFVPKYLYFNLDARYDELRALSAGDGGRGGLNLRIIRSLIIPFPQYDEQEAIAAVLSDMDTEIAALEARRDKTRELKQAMMQQLLTGRTRLV